VLQNVIARKKYRSKYDERINVSITVVTTLTLNAGLATLFTTLGSMGSVAWYHNVGACIVIHMIYDIVCPNLVSLIYSHSKGARKCF
jgi:hypothetical protein